MQGEIDLRAAINAVSDVIANRPRPLREFDQIHMKAGDMVLQSEFIARWSQGKRLAFIGDGDAISVCVAYLHARRIIDVGPARVTVFDFDERVVKAVERFADHERIETLDAQLYNCIDALPKCPSYDAFYTNPPWGASNDGESVNVFVQRGIEAIRYNGSGIIVIADDDELRWPRRVLAKVQEFVINQGFAISRMMPKLHSYHLDDNPNLRSCNIEIASIELVDKEFASAPIQSRTRLDNFYGDGLQPRVRYVKERKRVDYGMAHDSEYELELLEDPAWLESSEAVRQFSS